MLADQVRFHDVNDAEAFVQATINRSRRIYPNDLRDELVAEGLRIMVDLADRFQAHREGYEQEGRFSGFAAKYLPLKLEDAYHRLCPEHTLRTCPESGKRTWHYGDRAVSLEALTAEDPDRHQLMASPQAASDLAKRLKAALWERAEREIDMTVQIGELLGEGATPADVASILGLPATQVRAYMEAIGKVAHRLQSEAA